MAEWEWIPLTEEDLQGEALDLTEEDLLALKLEQHYGATPDEPDSYLIALGRYQADVEKRPLEMSHKLAELDGRLAYEEAIQHRNRGVNAASNARLEAGNETTEEVKRALEDKLDLHPAHAEKSNRALAGYLAGALSHLSESTIRKHLNKIRKK